MSDSETKNSRYKADSTEKSPGENIMKFSASEDSYKAGLIGNMTTL